jgi:phosphohistidine swiveling domain-containing protein
LAEFGVLVDVDFAVIGGWQYLQIRPVGAPRPRRRPRPSRKPAGTPPRWLLRALFKVVPAIRRRIAAAETAVATDLSGRVVDRWYDHWRAEASTIVTRLTELDLTSMTDDELDRHFQLLIDAYHTWGRIHVRLGAAWSIIMYELHQVCRDLFGWGTDQTLRLVAGLSSASTEPARQLAALARLAAERPAVRALLEQIDDTTPEHLRAADPGFADAFDEYLTHYAARGLTYELMDPTLREDPRLLLRLVRDQLALGFDPADADARGAAAREEIRQQALRLLESRPPESRDADRDRFAHVLARAQRAYPVREDNEWFTTSVWVALGRYAALEFGARLAARGQVTKPEDAFMLTIDELRLALQDGSGQHELVAQRRGQRAWALANPGPMYYGQKPSGSADEPPFDLLPPGAQLVNEAAMWSLAQSGDSGAHSGPAGDGIRGVAASAGRYTGPVRVIMGEHEFAKLRPGDVVVCPVTAPVWSVLYPSMGALVTDHGGILSHPAIIAREYGLPAVVGTQDATSRLRDGQLVTVDGTLGTVEIRQ